MGLFEIFYYFVLAFYIFLIVFLFSIFVIFMYALFSGGPYAPAAHNRIKTMIKLLKPKKGQKMVDLGSGDGRIVIEFAKLGVEAHGYEINPFLVFWSRFRIRKLGLQNKAFIHFKDYWAENFSKFNTVTLFTSPFVLGRVERKLLRELKKGSKVVSNSFKLPKSKPIKQENKVFLYEIK